MPWVRFDDGYLTNPKIIRAGRDGRDFHQACIFYAARELTDGHIPTEALPLVGLTAGLADWSAACRRCADLGLLEPCDDGYRIHDYHEYQPTREHVKAVSRSRAEAGQAGGIASGQSREAKSKQFASRVLEANTKPVPVPVPVPDSISSSDDDDMRPAPVESVTPSKPAKYPPAFEAFWSAYPRQDGRAWPKPAALAEWRKLRPDGECAEAIMAGVAAWKAGRDWRRGFVMRPDRWLKERCWEEPPAPWSGRDETPPPSEAPRGHQPLDPAKYTNGKYARFFQRDRLAQADRAPP